MDLLEAQDAAKQRHPWELARLSAIRRILSASVSPSPRSILDFGCGDAFSGTQLASAWPSTRLVGVDRNFSDVHLDELRSAHPRATFVREVEELSSSCFDLVLLLDVLEHIDNDKDVLQELAGNYLAPGGRVLITVPAFPFLFSPHDDFLRHYRRYTHARLHSLIRSVGLEISDWGYLFGSLLLARACSLALQSVGVLQSEVRGSQWDGGPILTRLLTKALEVDNDLLLGLSSKSVRLPGLSTWALCQKPR